MTMVVTYSIQLEIPGNPEKDEDEYLDHRDSIQSWLENAVDWSDVRLVSSDVDSEEWVED